MATSDKQSAVGSFLAEKLFKVDPFLVDESTRRLLPGQKNKSLSRVVAEKLISDITPSSIKKILEITKKVKSDKVKKARQIIEKRRDLLAKRRGGTSQLDFLLNQLSTDKSYDAGEKNLLKVLQATKNNSLIEEFWKVKENSKSEKVSPFESRGKAFLKALQRDRSFTGMYKKVIGGDNYSSFFSAKPSREQKYPASFFTAGDSASSSLQDSTGGYPGFNRPSLNTSLNGSEESYALQLKTYKLIDTSFKVTNEQLKKIATSLQRIEGNDSGLSLGEAAGAGGAAALALKKGRSLLGKVARNVGKVAKVGGYIAAPALAGYEAYKDIKAISKAESLGLFTPEQASLLKKQAVVKKGVAAGYSVAGAAIGAVTTGGIGAAAGGYTGYKLGQEAGSSMAESMYGSKIDRTSAYLATVANMESSLNANPNATGTSSAKGLFQFTDGTWNQLNKKYKKGYALGGKQDPRLDPKKSSEMMKLLTQENQLSLEKRLGRPVTDTELYMAHFLGPQGAAKLIETNAANPSANASDILPAAAQANQGIFNSNGQARSTGEVVSLLSDRYSKKAAEFGLGVNAIIPSPQLLPGNSNTASISDADISNYSKQEKERTIATTSAVSAAVDRLTAANVEQSKNQKPVMINSGGGGHSGNNQSLFSDISSIHFMDGLLLNILTD